MAPPETRTTTAESIAAIGQTVADLVNRTATIESFFQNQTTTNERVAASLEKIFNVLEKLQEGRISERRDGKQPDDGSVTDNSAPLLPTPTTNTLPHMSFGHPYSPSQQHYDQSHHNPVRRNRSEAPFFNGEAVTGWIFQMERYFEQQGVPSEHKLAVATSYITGDALDWYQFMYTTHQLLNWETFVADLRARFGPSPYENLEVTLGKLRQTSTVVAYAAEFETLATRTPSFSASNLLHIFLGGLRDEIHQELIVLEPKNLRNAMHMAKIAEQRLCSYKSWNNTRFGTSQPHPSYNPMSIPNQTHITPTTQQAGLPIRRLTPAQMATRREKGLCYNCDEKFSPGHKCKPRFQCLLMQEEHVDDCDEENEWAGKACNIVTEVEPRGRGIFSWEKG